MERVGDRLSEDERHSRDGRVAVDLHLRRCHHYRHWFIVALVMPDTYHDSRFLTHRQKYLMAAREAQAAEYNWDDGFSWAEVRKALKDPMVHVCAFAQLVSHPIFGSGTC